MSEAKKDEGAPKEQKVNWYADMAMTVTFLLEIFALLRHCQKRSENEGEEYVLVELVAGVIVIFFAIMLCKRISSSIAKWISSTFNPEKDPMSDPVKLSRFTDQSWQLVVHVSATIFELAILSETKYSWISNPDEAWTPPPWKQKVNPLVETFYKIQLCIWVATGLSHKFVDERNKDYFVMYAHHIATLGLVFGSWSLNYTRIGVLVLFVHDSSDIVVDVLKMANHLKLEGKKFFYIVEICFVTNLVTWALSRGWYLGTRIIPSTAFGAVREILKAEYQEAKYALYQHTKFHSEEEIDGLTNTQLMHVGSTIYNFYKGSNILLVALLCMNIYWFFLFVKILIGLTCKGKDCAEMGDQVYVGRKKSKKGV